MVKARTHEIGKNLKALEARFRAVLVYGPDDGLVRDRTGELVAQFADDPKDAFQVARLAPGDLTSDPARLADELAAIPMLGGRRLVVVESATDALAATVESALALSALSEAVTGGRVQALDTLIDRAFAAGENAIGILRVVGRRFERLHTVQAEVAGGKNQAAALKSLRPPLFFKEEAAFRADLRRWPLGKLDRALETLAEGEIQCKTTGLPTEAVCARTCLSLAAGASRPVDPAH